MNTFCILYITLYTDEFEILFKKNFLKAYSKTFKSLEKINV